MSRIKYVLHPGPVWSRYDGDRHFVGAAQLAALYRVPPGECVTHNDLPWWKAPEGAIHLFPREDGDYTLERRP